MLTLLGAFLSLSCLAATETGANGELGVHSDVSNMVGRELAREVRSAPSSHVGREVQSDAAKVAAAAAAVAASGAMSSEQLQRLHIAVQKKAATPASQRSQTGNSIGTDHLGTPRAATAAVDATAGWHRSTEHGALNEHGALSSEELEQRHVAAQKKAEPVTVEAQPVAAAVPSVSSEALEQRHVAAQKKAEAVIVAPQPVAAVVKPNVAVQPVAADPRCAHCKTKCKTAKCSKWCEQNHCQTITATAAIATTAAPATQLSTSHCAHCKANCKTAKCNQWCDTKHCQTPMKMSTSRCDHCLQTCKTAKCKAWCSNTHCGDQKTKGFKHYSAAALKAMSPAQKAAALATMSPQGRAAALAAMSLEDRVATLTAMSSGKAPGADGERPGYNKEIETEVHHKVDLRFKDMVSGKPGKGATGVLKKKRTKK